MSTHTSLEDMTQAARLELFQHHLPAQITSFPIDTEISSSTLCQLLTEELGVRLIDLSPFSDEVTQVARRVIVQLQQAAEVEEDEVIESAAEDAREVSTEKGAQGEPTFWHAHTHTHPYTMFLLQALLS